MIYIFIVIIVVGAVLNYFCKKYALDGVTYTRTINKKHVEQNEEFHIITVTENRKVLPVTFLNIKEYLGEGTLYNESSMTLLPYQRVIRNYTKKIDKRGRYAFRKVELQAGDLLGFDVVKKEEYDEDEIIVYPKPMDLDKDMTMIGEFIGDTSVKRWIVEDPIVTVGVREYTGFEPEKNIHWMSSLRTGELMVRNFDYTSDNSLFMIINIEDNTTESWIGTDEETLERCFSLARTIVDDAEENRVKYGMITNASGIDSLKDKKYISPGLGQTHYYNILDCLGSACNITSTSFNNLIDETIESHIQCKTFVIITPSLSKKDAEYINKISHQTQRTLLFSMREENMDYIEENVIKYVLGSDKNEA